MKKLLLATAFMMSGCGGLALAQTPAPVTTTAPATIPADAPATGEMRPSGGPAVPAARPDDPNTTGPDKVNGLEVPQMKDSREGGRQ